MMFSRFWPPTTLGDFYRIPEKLPKLSADKMYRARETKDQTLKKIRTLHFPEKGKEAGMGNAFFTSRGYF